MAFEKPTDVQIENRFKYHAPKGDQAAFVNASATSSAKWLRNACSQPRAAQSRRER